MKVRPPPRDSTDMESDPRDILPGDRVMVFDARLFVDDVKTPLSMTMQPATVLRRYGFRSIPIPSCDLPSWIYEDVVDVKFDRDGRESKGHFTSYVEEIL